MCRLYFLYCLAKGDKNYMRECIYCGRQLEKGEKCQCAMAVAKRREKEGMNAAGAQGGTNGNDTAKQAKKQEKKKEKEKARAEKARAKEQKKQRRENVYNTARSSINKGLFRNVWQLTKNFFKSPFETVMNPGLITKAEIFTIVIIEGIIAGLCIFSILTGTSRGSLRLLTSLMGFGGIAGYKLVMGWIASAISGAIAGCVVFVIYTGIFYFINKWIFRKFTPFWEFGKRLVFVGMPFTVIGTVGVLLGFFSQTTFAILLITGLVSVVILTYEVLRSMWISDSVSKVMYAMMLGYMVFLLIALYFVRISVLI